MDLKESIAVYDGKLIEFEPFLMTKRKFYGLTPQLSVNKGLQSADAVWPKKTRGNSSFRAILTAAR